MTRCCSNATSQNRKLRLYLAALGEARGRAVLAVGPGAQLLGLLAARVALVQVARLVVVLARVGDGARVAVVGVDTAQDAAVLGDDVLDDDVARPAVVLAVAAGARQLAVVAGEEAVDDDGAAPVELEDLVRGVEGAAAVDVRGAARLLEGRGVLADVGPPDVVQGAVGWGGGSAHGARRRRVYQWSLTKCPCSGCPRPGKRR